MNQQQPKKQEIKITDNIPGAEYANLMQVRHSKDEFQMLFANILVPSGRMVSKIITNPGHFKMMVKAMEENIKKYEDQFGVIEEAKAPQGTGKMGFEDRE